MTSQPTPVLCETDALFLDFDGTLAPIQEDPDSVTLPEGGAITLREIERRLGGALAIVSGRDIRDLSRRIPRELWRAGGHGLEVCAPGQLAADGRAQAPQELVASVTEIATAFAGVRIEDKGRIIAVHYRAAPDAGAALAESLRTVVADRDDYLLEHGKCVFELKPVGIGKGSVVAMLMSRSPFANRRPVMIGDDTTDEAAMAEVLRLGGYAIKVGEGDTVAPYRVGAPEDVWRWLEKLI